MTDLRYATACTVKIGPFLDSGDGATPETGLTIAQADVRLTKCGGDYAQKNEASNATHDEKGEYDCPLDVTDVNTLGPMKMTVQMAGALPVWEYYDVLTQAEYDRKYGSTLQTVNVTQIEGADATNQIAASVVGAKVDLVDAPNSTAVSALSAGNWGYQSSMMTVAGSIGKWIIDHLDALISSRAAAGDQMNLVDAPNATAITAIQAGLAAAGDEMNLVDAPNTTALTAISTSNWTFAGAAGRTLTSLGTLLNSIPQAIWEYARRTLTQTAAQVAAATAGPNLAVTRFCTFENEFENLTIPATWQVMWLTAKRSKKDRDANAQFMVRVTNGGAASDGGQYYNKTVATSTTMAYASLTVDQPGSSVALLIKDEGTALLADGSYHYDIKYLETDGSIHQLAGEADFEIDSSYTQAVV